MLASIAFRLFRVRIVREKMKSTMFVSSLLAHPFKFIFGVLGALLVLYLLAIVWTLNAYRFKVIDPKDPNFKAENFRFEDYFLDEDIKFRDAKAAIFTFGTDKNFVEKILIQKNGAKEHDYTVELKINPVQGAVSLYRYDYSPWWNPAYKIFGLINGVMFEGALFPILVYYDKNNKIVKVE